MSLQVTGVRLDHLATGSAGIARIPGGNAPEVLDASGQSEVVVPGQDFIVNAEYQRVGGDLVLSDFVSGTDDLQFVSSAFGNLALGNLIDGTSFFNISDAYDGTNGGQGAADPAFIYSQTDHTLYYDGNGTAAGYTVVATVQSSTEHVNVNDIQIVAA
jgi:hypothetical protein